MKERERERECVCKRVKKRDDFYYERGQCPVGCGLFAKERLCLDLGESNSLVLGDALKMRNLDFLLLVLKSRKFNKISCIF